MEETMRCQRLRVSAPPSSATPASFRRSDVPAASSRGCQHWHSLSIPTAMSLPSKVCKVHQMSFFPVFEIQPRSTCPYLIFPVGHRQRSSSIPQVPQPEELSCLRSASNFAFTFCTSSRLNHRRSASNTSICWKVATRSSQVPRPLRNIFVGSVSFALGGEAPAFAATTVVVGTCRSCDSCSCGCHSCCFDSRGCDSCGCRSCGCWSCGCCSCNCCSCICSCGCCSCGCHSGDCHSGGCCSCGCCSCGCRSRGCCSSGCSPGSGLTCASCSFSNTCGCRGSNGSASDGSGFAAGRGCTISSAGSIRTTLAGNCAM
mmetsp:Transcript_68155/g.197568  ORF Transcript_68155/g.197568 Transcript_68155/m.197568 type:complete len:315 (-) Transcript_68155:287-1231(-)